LFDAVLTKEKLSEPRSKKPKSREKKKSYSIGCNDHSKSEGNKPEMPKDKSDKTSKLIQPTPKLPSDRPSNDVAGNDSVTKAPKRAQNNGKSIKPSNTVETEVKVNLPEPTYPNRSTKSFESDNAAFTESICKKAESGKLSSDQLLMTLRNLQVEFGETNPVMPLQLNIFLGSDIVNAQIKRLEELQQWFRNQHIVDGEKIAKIQAALRNATI